MSEEDLLARLARYKQRASHWKRAHDNVKSEVAKARQELEDLKAESIQTPQVSETVGMVLNKNIALKNPGLFRWKIEVWMDNAGSAIWETGAFKPKFDEARKMFWKAYLYPGRHSSDLGSDSYFLRRFEQEGNGTYKESQTKVSLRNNHKAWLQFKLICSPDGGITKQVVQSFKCKHLNLNTPTYEQGGNIYLYRSYRKIKGDSGHCVTHLGFKRLPKTGEMVLRSVDFMISKSSTILPLPFKGY